MHIHDSTFAIVLRTPNENLIPRSTLLTEVDLVVTALGRAVAVTVLSTRAQCAL